MKAYLAAAALCALMIMPAVTFAGPDEFQRQTQQRLQESNKKLEQAEKAKGAERDKLMQEHMKMMDETMGKMQTMKPRPGMSMKEHEEWMDEHWKLMQQMMDQMMKEHHLLMKGRGK